MKRLLLVTETWPPAWSGGVQRPLQFARHLRAYGFETTVLAPEIDPRTRLDPSLSELAHGIECHRVPVKRPWLDRLPGTARRALKQLSHRATPLPDGLAPSLGAFVARAQALHRATPFRAVFSTSPPHSLALLGVRVKADLGLPWIADFRDEWSRNRLRTSAMSPEERSQDRLLEEDSFRAADLIVTTTETMRAFAIASGVRPERAVTISNGFDEDDLPPDSEHVYGERLVITYLGTLSSYRNLDPLLEAARMLRGEMVAFPFLFRFITPGGRARRFVRGYEDLVRDGIVRLDDALPHREGLAEAKKADVLLHVLSGASAADEPVAGKLFEYLALARPILFVTSVRGENARILTETETGVTVDLNDVSAIKAALCDLHRKWLDRALTVHPRGIEQYSRRRLAERLARELETVLP
jgi:glycosyltransferase involved in cell wall biosynthesis